MTSSVADSFDGDGLGVADPVAAAREWLIRNGGAPPDTGQVRPEAQGQVEAHEGHVPAGRSGVERSASAARGGGRRQGDQKSRRPEDSAPASPSELDPEADPETVARTIVLRKLAAQARTRQELAKALAARQVPEVVAQQVLDRMESVGLVDDAAFARDWVASRQQRRHLSTSALRRELQTKGVDRDHIDDAVAVVDADDELAAAQALAERKLRSMSGLTRDVQYRRLAGALARRGFGAGVTTTVLAAVLKGGSES